jgi:hypothetical protein
VALSTKSFPTTTPGHRQLLDWLSSVGEIDVVAVEDLGFDAARGLKITHQQSNQVDRARGA